MRKKGLLAGFVVGVFVGLFFAPGLAGPAPKTESIAETFGLPSEWDTSLFVPLGVALREIQKQYVDDVAPDKLLVGAYHGILSKLDDYSAYMPPEPYEEFKADTEGEFGGLGVRIYFNPLDKLLSVDQPIPGTPAFRAGVVAGDIITAIREVSTGAEYDPSKFEDVHEAAKVLRGAPGTQVTITVFHKETREQEDITIERAIIKVPGARGERMIDEERKIGYVYVASFHEHTVGDLETRLNELNKQGLKALILDLRFNPGGLLRSAVEVSDMFLDSGVVVSVRGKEGPRAVERATNGDILNGAPLVILTNRYSASGAEIVAAAIKENKRGILVGETTFGKGSVQSIIELGRDKGAIKLTTARYYTPDEVCIEKKGIVPDVELKLSNDEMRELVLSLSDTVQYPPEPINETTLKPNQEPMKDTTPKPNQEPNKEEEKKPFRDVQLERAVDILIGMLIQRERGS